MVFLAGLTPAQPARACNIPVFRYALERWRAELDQERYEVILFKRGSLTRAEEKAKDILCEASVNRPGRANLVVTVVDVDGRMAEPLRKLWQAQGQVQLAWLVVRYPESAADGATAWAGPLTETTARCLVDSPARRELARRLLLGQSAVWILLESGHKDQDDAAAKMVQKELRHLEKALQLPEGAGEGPVRLLAKLPLAISFSLLRIARADPAEEMVVALLRNSDQDVARCAGPIVFPVFGRGRVLDGLMSKGITPENLEESARFVCGPCSCQVKVLNPGVDLLMAVDWDSILEDGAPLEARAPAGSGEIVPIPRPPADANRVVDQTSEAAPRETASQPIIMAIVLASLLVVGTGSLAYWRRHGKDRRPFAVATATSDTRRPSAEKLP